MIGDRYVQILPALDSHDRRHGNTKLLQFDLDLLVMRVERRIVKIGGTMAKIDHDQRDGQRQFQLVRSLDQPGQVMGLVAILLDQTAVLQRALLLHRHPRLQRHKIARQNKTVVDQPGHNNGR